MTNRYNYISTGGDLIPYINDDRRESILNAADEYLPQQRWGSAILAEMKRVERYVRDGIEEGTFLFDTETGQRISGLYNRLTKGEGLLALLAGILTAVVTGSITIGRYGLKGSTYKHKGTEALDLSRDEEQHVRTTSRRVPITDGGGGHGGGHSGGGGGHSTSVHHSSSGTMHGGGGHHF